MLSLKRFGFPSLASAGLFCALELIGSNRAHAQAVQFPAASPAATVEQRVGLTDIVIHYSRPSSKGRHMLGGVNPYGQVWRTGANAATTVSFSTLVRLNGVAIPAGTYSLFTIPRPHEWTIILNRVAKQWGAFSYKASEDLARFSATAEALPQPVETFTIGFGDLRDDSATLYLEWEGTRVPIAVKVDIVPKLLKEIHTALAEPGTKKAGFYLSAAQFYFDHGQDLGEALKLVDAMLAQNPPIAFEGLYLKARILAKQGDKAGAIAAAKASREQASHFEGGHTGIEPLDDALVASLSQ